uniref:Transforming growth factor beta receptor 3 like n=1 Tax=Gopherus evgoodei TaxID=1825980 RepID=A0A8C4Y7L5_9SAUR
PYPPPPASLPQFSCSSPALSEPSHSVEPIPDLPVHLGRVLLSLEVYSSEAFTKAQGPCTVLANSRVFVEAALAAFDPRLSFSIRLCFLSPSSSSSLDSPYTLVRGGCPAHPDVSLHPPHKGAAGPALPPGSQELQRLSFLLRPLYNDSIQFLHCRLALCTQDTGRRYLSEPCPFQCGPQARACPSSHVGEPGSGRFQHTFTKPIIVTVGRLARATKPTPGTGETWDGLGLVMGAGTETATHQGPDAIALQCSAPSTGIGTGVSADCQGRATPRGDMGLSPSFSQSVSGFLVLSLQIPFRCPFLWLAGGGRH